MTKLEAQKFFIRELEKFPRKIRKVDFTPEEIRGLLANKLEFKELKEWLKRRGNHLDLSMFLIGSRMDFTILYFILSREQDGEVFGNYKIFNDSAQDVCLDMIKKLDTLNIELISLEKFIEFAKEEIWER